MIQWKLDRLWRAYFLAPLFLLITGCYHYLPETEEPAGSGLHLDRSGNSHFILLFEPKPEDTRASLNEPLTSAREGTDLEARIAKIEERVADLEELVRLLTFDEVPNIDRAGQDRNILGFMDEAKTAFEAGDYETAMERMEEVMQLKPSHEEAVRLLERVRIEFLVEVLSKGGKFKNFAEWLVNPSCSSEAKRCSKALIEEVIEDLKSDDERRCLWAMKRLVFEIGAPAAPALTMLLGDERQKVRESVIITLGRMGPGVTPFVVDCLKSKNIMKKHGALIVLSNIGDDEAVPALQSFAAEPNQPVELRKIAAEVIRSILRKARKQE